MSYNLLATAIVFGGIANAAVAQSEAPGQGNFVVAHRLTDWRIEHFDDGAKAQQLAESVKKLGGEVQVNDHGGHTDVKYRSIRWKAMRVNSDEIAHQWEDWLKAAGFETIHGHSPEHDDHAHHQGHDHAQGAGNEHGEVVLYRSANWASQHFDDPADADEFFNMAQALRCQVEKTNHGGHIDVRFVCPEWSAVEFDSHQAADAWMKWLTSAGFEVQHDH